MIITGWPEHIAVRNLMEIPKLLCQVICAIYLNPDGPRSVFLLFSFIFFFTNVVVAGSVATGEGAAVWAK
ncbi:MAG TPA: hypothetical protein VGK74_21695, partial [Symbiobacteriaceae bacterium]